MDKNKDTVTFIKDGEKRKEHREKIPLLDDIIITEEIEEEIKDLNLDASDLIPIEGIPINCPHCQVNFRREKDDITISCPCCYKPVLLERRLVTPPEKDSL